MDMQDMQTVATGVAMAITIAGAMLAVGAPKIIHAIFGLAIALAGIAGTFALLNSPFVATMQVLIYIGGITVAMVFAVMLSSAGQREPKQTASRHVMAGIVSILFVIGVGSILLNTDYGTGSAVADASTRAESHSEKWSVEAIGIYLLNDFNVVFELLSVVLLVAIVGAITIAGRDDESLDPSIAQEDEA